MVDNGIGNQGGRPCRKDDGDIQLTALGIDRVIFCIAGINLGQVWIHRRPAQTQIRDGMLQFFDGFHPLVGIEPDKTDKFVRKGFGERDDTVIIGLGPVCGLTVPSGDDRPDNVVPVQRRHHVFKGLWFHFGEIDVFA
jgi:hypothetical protein